MNTNTQHQLRNAFDVSHQYYIFLNLGYFFEIHSKNVNLSRLSSNIQIQNPQGKPYTLNPGIIQASLQNIYEHPTEISFFSHLILLNSLRGITMAIASSLENTKESE